MATITIPRLVGKTNKTGLTSWYWQPSKTLRTKGWTAQGLGQSIGQDVPEHIAAAARALNEKVDGAADLPLRELRRIQRPLTVDQAIDRYRTAGYPSVRKGREGKALDKATIAQYEKKFKVLEPWGKGVALSSITDERVTNLRIALMKPAAGGRYKGQVRHHHAHEVLRVGRALFRWFEQERLIPKGSNPFTDFGLSLPDPRQHVWWAPARKAILASAADAGDLDMELAIDLAFQIGQREADLLRLQLRQYEAIPHYKMDAEVYASLSQVPVPAYGDRDGYGPGDVWGITVRQNKGKRWVEVPIVGITRARVEAAIAAAKSADVTCILFDRDRGLPWTQPSIETGQRRFIRRFGEMRASAIAAARGDGDEVLAGELEQLQYRDFRRTAVVYLGELGVASHMIAAITGHILDDTEKILETYLPRTTGMAARAIALSHARAPAAKQEQAS